MSLAALPVHDERIAIIEPGRGKVSYARLDALADRVAARLLALELRAGARIGLYLHRSSDAVAALLGILRAGYTYVPVDPHAPAARNAEILAECGVATSLVEECFVADYRAAVAALGGGPALQVLGPVGLGAAIEVWAPEAAAPQPDAESEIACILYTSGSTGRHKGWAMSRTAVAAHARWSRETLRPGPGDVFANHAQMNFGMSLFDIFSSLTSGFPLVLVPDNARQFAGRVVDVLERERVTIWFSGPAILSLIAELDGLETRKLDALRWVAFAGEPFPAPMLAKLRQRLPHPRYFNFWGSTETNVGLFYELPAEQHFDEPPPIGRPCAHYEARLVGQDGAVVPLGSVGELQLRGVGLDTGYLDQPQLNAERLLKDATGEGCWYRTGDLAVEGPDGQLRYRGRIGRMLKLRGYRIEPGEIEIRLNEHSQIVASAVLPGEIDGRPCLVAHLGAPKLPLVELKQFCAEKLPTYMVPERFVFHTALPRNLRGKIDFEALRRESF